MWLGSRVCPFRGLNSRISSNPRVSPFNTRVSPFNPRVSPFNPRVSPSCKRFLTHNGTPLRRCPIISVLGHVDHGKTTLIDALRKTNNVSLESGGITQKNSVFQHTIQSEKGESFTFTILDTPGHAAFSSMRSRGAVLTDLAILILSAAEGVKPQTVEVIKLIQSNKVPVVVALNKADLPTANVDRCLEELLDFGIETQQIGGNVPAVPISALHGHNITALMESVQSVANTLDLHSTASETPGEVVVFDIDRTRSHIEATVVVTKGTLKMGDVVVSTDTMMTASIKNLFAFDGTTPITAAIPGMPAVLKSFSARSLPPLGSTVINFSNDNRSAKRDAVEYLKAATRDFSDHKHTSSPERYKKKVPFVICGDCQATLDTLREMFTVDHEHVNFSIFQESLNVLSEYDVRLAESIGAQIVLFNVDPIPFPTTAKIHQFNVIYDLASSIQDEVNDTLPAVYEDVTQGNGTIAEIHGTRNSRVVGVKDVRGVFNSSALFRLYKDNRPVWVGPIATLRYNKAQIVETDPKTMQACGIMFHKKSLSVDVEVGDRIECFNEKRVFHNIISDKFFGLNNANDIPMSKSV